MFSKLEIFRDLFAFLWKRKLWWIIPMVTVFLVIGLLLIFIGSSPLAPIIYPLF